MINTLASVLLCILFFGFTTPVRAAVVINEVYPKITNVAWEWVELYNTDSTSVSLDRWKLDHTAGDAKSFILNASAIIQPHGFLTFYGSQTAINFGVDGDTVRLFDANGSLVDSQSYPGTLGYNTSIGRSADGGDGWVICTPDPYAATPNASNNCPPAPTPTATPIPTPTSTPTPQPKADRPLAETPTATPTSAPQTFGSLIPSPTGQALGVTVLLTPSPTPTTDVLQFKISKTWIAYLLLGIAAAALSIMLVMFLRRRKIRQ